MTTLRVPVPPAFIASDVFLDSPAPRTRELVRRVSLVPGRLKGFRTIAIRRRGFRREDMRPTGPRMNERIRISPVQLIDENGENAGVVETH